MSTYPDLASVATLIADPARASILSALLGDISLPAGGTWFHSFGIDCTGLQQKRRAFARTCLDWSERKPHMAGALGAAVLQRLLEQKWIIRVRNSRTVQVTDLGCQQFQNEFSLNWK